MASGLTSLVDIVRQNGGDADKYTGNGTGAAHKH